jgi:hypothetical protein
VDPRALPKNPTGLREAWVIIDEAWSATVADAEALTEESRDASVNGEWSFTETLRHLIFVSDAWVRRTILAEPRPYHRYGLPPDGDVDVMPWGIDVQARPTFDEVLLVRRERMAQVGKVFEGLTDRELVRACAQHPEPGFPPVTTMPVGFCLDVVVGEEWAHHSFAARDLELLREA